MRFKKLVHTSQQRKLCAEMESALELLARVRAGRGGGRPQDSGCDEKQGADIVTAASLAALDLIERSKSMGLSNLALFKTRPRKLGLST